LKNNKILKGELKKKARRINKDCERSNWFKKTIKKKEKKVVAPGPRDKWPSFVGI